VTQYAIDASTVLASVLRETHTRAARAFLGDLTVNDELLGPGLLLAECTSNLRELIFDGALTPSEGRGLLERILSLGIHAITALEHNRAALQIADDRRSRKAYDAHYLAAAAMTGAELVTIDGGMYQGAVELRIAARLLR
jgi:predicted nucleic acid-binding protein